MSILYLKQCTRYSVKSLLRVSIVCQIILALSNAIKKLNQRTLRTLSTTLVLSILLSACGGGGGGGGTTADGGSGGDTPVGGGSTPAPNSNITLSVGSSLLLVNEDFVGSRVIANATSATQITVTESTTGVVTVTTSTTAVSVSSIENAHGETILTIIASDGVSSMTNRVTVRVSPDNDPPTLSVSTNNISALVDFSTITINTTASDVEEGALTFTVQASPPGVVSITTSTNAIVLNAIPGATGQTNLTVRTVDNSNTTGMQTIVVNVLPPPNVPPVLIVSTNRISVQEDFNASVIIRTTATDANGDAITLSVSSSSRLVDAAISALSNGISTITLTAIENANGTATLNVQASANGQSVSTDIIVTVAPINDPPTLSVSTNNISANFDFSTITIHTTASDVEEGALTFSVQASSSGVVSVTTSANAIILNAMTGVSGQTTLTVRTTDTDGLSTLQTIVVNVLPPTNVPPVLIVSTNRISVQEDFRASVIIRTTATDADGDTITLSVSSSSRLVDAAISVLSNGISTITLTAIENANGTTTLNVQASANGQSVSTDIIVMVAPVNDTPTLSVSTNNITTLGGFSPITINTTASDVDEGTLTFTVQTSNSGVLSVTTSANAIMLNAMTGASGRTTLTVSVVDNSGAMVTQTIAVNVIIRPSVATPVVTVSTNLISVQEDFRGSVVFQATATDADGDTITLSVSPLTSLVNAAISAPFSAKSTLTNSITLTAIANANGTTTLTVQVGDAGGQSESTEIVVVVAAVEDTPTLTITTAILTVAEDFAGATTLATAFDNDEGDSLSFSVVESTTGVVSVTTSASGVQVERIAHANGVTTLTITVSDGTLSATAQVVVTVTPVNDPPSLSVSTTAVTLNEDFASIAPITLTIGDLENDPLTLTVTESNTGVVTVRTTVTTTAPTIQLSNIAHANGVTTLTIAIFDGSVSSTAQVGVTVLAVNDTPTLSVSTNSISANVNFSTITINTTASDVEDNNLSFAVTASPAGIVRATTSANAIVLNAITGASGQTTLTVRVVDSSGATVTQIISVNVIIRPSVAAPVVTVSTNLISVQEDFRGSVVFQTTATDADGDTITLSVSSSSRLVEAVISTPVNGKRILTNSITLTAVANANGTATLTVLANDAGGRSDSTEIVVVVAAVEDTPTLTITTATLTVPEDFAGATTLATAFDNDEGDSLSFSVVESTTGVVSVTTSASGVQVERIENANGATTLTITVSDGTLSATAQVVVTVTPVNDPPTLTITTATLTVPEDFAGATTLATAFDNDEGDSLSFSVVESTTGVVSVTASASGVQVESTTNTNGATTLTITVSDGRLSTTAQVVVTVTPVNDPPALSISTTALTLNEDFATTEVITVSRNDIDSNTLTFTVSESATGVVTVTTTDAGVQVTNIRNANGATTLTISLSDGDLTTTTQVVVTVTPVNDPPALSISTTALTLNEDFATTEVITVSRNDIDSNTLTFTVSESATGVVTVTTTDAGVQVTNIRNANGATTLTISLSDGDLTTTTQVVVAVNPVNDPPTLSAFINPINSTEDFQNYLLPIIRDDVDGDTVTITVSESTTGVLSVAAEPISIDVGIAIRSIDHAFGNTTITVTAFDGTTSTSILIPVTIAPVNDPPSLSVSTTALTLNEDFASTELITVTRTDIDSNTLTLTVSESATGVVTVTITDAGVQVANITDTNGVTTLTISLSDGDLTTTTQVVVTVNPVNDPPTLSVSTTALTLNEDFASTELITVTRTDIDSNTLTLTVTESNSNIVNISTSAAGVVINSIASAFGQTILTISVNDGNITTSTQVRVTVIEINNTPTLNVSTTALTLIEDFSTTFLITIMSNDIDNDPLTISVTESTTGVVNVIPSASDVRITAIAHAHGQTTITITVNDGSVLTSVPVLVTVSPQNDPPTIISISTTALTFSEDFNTTALITVTSDDADGDTLTISVSESNSGIVRITTLSSAVQLVSIGNANGRTVLTVNLSDEGGLSVSTEVVVVVTVINDPPILTVSTNIISTIGGFTPITIDTTASDVEDDVITFAVQQSPSGVVRVTTSANAIVLNNIPNVSGQTTLTIRTSDSSGSMAVQTIAVNVAINPSSTPVLTVSTSFISLQEDFNGFVNIGTTVTDSDVGGFVTLSVRSSPRLVDTVILRPRVDIIAPNQFDRNAISISSIEHLNGTTTLTVQATDSGGLSHTTEIVAVIHPVNDPIWFTFPSTIVTLTPFGDQINRNVQSIIINNPGNEADRVQLGLTHSGDPIFSANPAPVTSFTTNALMTVTTLTSTVSTAQLYFTIAPNQTGTATLTVHLNNLTDLRLSTRTMVVSVSSPNVPATIVPANPSITNLIVHGGRLYANDASVSSIGNARFLTTARALGGHLLNINSVEEYSFVLIPTLSGLTAAESWLGLVLPERTFPGELSWITHDSTIAYGYSSANDSVNLRVYPGHYPLPWDAGVNGLRANRTGRTTTMFNWTIYASGNGGVYFLVDDSGDGINRNVIYEFPQGLTPTSINPISLNSGTNANLSLTGFDLNGDTINTNDWSITDPTGGSAIFNHTAGSTGVQTVNMIYTASTNFDGQTTVVVNLQVNGLTTTYAISFIVDGPPIIALSTHTIVLDEDFGSFVIGTSVTDQEMSVNVPYALQASSTNIVTISTSANTIQLTSVPHTYGMVTLRIQTTDSASQVASTQVVISVRSVNDTPTLTFSTDNITTLGGFTPITIDITVTDVEDVTLPFSVKASTTGVVSFTTSVNNIVLSSIPRGSGQTTLSVTVTDSSGTVVIRTIAINVIVVPGTTPVLRVSANLIRLQEDFGSVVIGTTATDADTGTLVVTVSSTTHLVNTVISTHSITLSSVAHLFGTTTLTVLATDPGGLSDSTEIVVIVQSVNDTPTLTVSSNTISLGSDPFVLDVSASDVEDGPISFSVSAGRGIVNTLITSRNLTITRLSLDGNQIVLAIRAVDKNNSIVSTNVTVILPTLLVITTGIKTLDFSWGAISTSSRYQLQSNPDGVAGFSDLSTTGIVISPNSTNIQQTTAQGLVSLHRYIPSVNNPQYAVRTCTATACESSFRHNTVALTQAQLNSMIGDFQGSNTAETDGFGFSVGLSGDGNTLAVGAPSEDSPGTGINGAQGDDIANFVSAGAVYLFRRNGGVWSQQAYIKALNPGVFQALGAAVDLSTDGNTLAAGVPRDNSGPNSASLGALNSGAVLIFRFSGGVWTQQAFLKASNAEDFDVFGGFISLSDDGNTLVTGVPNESSLSTGVNNFASNGVAQEVGAAYVFRFSTTTNSWSQQAYIKASNAEGGPPGTLGIGDQFGRSISLSGDGNTLAVGTPGEGSASTGINGAQDNNNAIDSGAVYLFRFSNGNWSQQAYIKSLNSERGDQFGISTSLNYDGHLLAVGASREDSVSTGINGAQDDNTLPETGAVYLFRFSSGSWTQQTYIKASSSNPDDRFGYSVNLSSDGNTLAVGALLEDGSSPGVNGTVNNGVQNSGAVFLLEFVNGAWVHKAYIKAPNPTTNDGFSSSLSLSDDGGALAVGISGFNGKGAYLY